MFVFYLMHCTNNHIPDHMHWLHKYSNHLSLTSDQSSRNTSRQVLSPQIHDIPVPPPPPPPPPRPVTVDSGAWTGEPQCQKSVLLLSAIATHKSPHLYSFSYILVQLFRPKGVAPGNVLMSPCDNSACI